MLINVGLLLYCSALFSHLTNIVAFLIWQCDCRVVVCVLILILLSRLVGQLLFLCDVRNDLCLLRQNLMWYVLRGLFWYLYERDVLHGKYVLWVAFVPRILTHEKL